MSGSQADDLPPRMLTNPPDSTRIRRLATVGLWRSWERASMAWKRSSVRSRSGPPNHRPTRSDGVLEPALTLAFLLFIVRRRTTSPVDIRGHGGNWGQLRFLQMELPPCP